jgi:hypothetical protein
LPFRTFFFYSLHPPPPDVVEKIIDIFLSPVITEIFAGVSDTAIISSAHLTPTMKPLINYEAEKLEI